MDEAHAMGPDLMLGIAVEDLADGSMLAGLVGDEAVLLARRGGDFFAIGATCTPINYVGHAESWDELAIEGDIAARDCLLRYRRSGRDLAVASIYRDIESLQAELEMERAAA